MGIKREYFLQCAYAKYRSVKPNTESNAVIHYKTLSRNCKKRLLASSSLSVCAR
jgi:hypothetical protein